MNSDHRYLHRNAQRPPLFASHPQPQNSGLVRKILAGILGVVAIAIVTVNIGDSQNSNVRALSGKGPAYRDGTAGAATSSADNMSTVKVFSRFADNPVAQKERKDLEASPFVKDLTALSLEKEAELLKSSECFPRVEQRHQELISKDLPHLAHELFKYCQLSLHGGLYLDADSPLLADVQDLLSSHPKQNVVVLSDEEVFSSLIHGSLLLLRQSNSPVAKGMLKTLMEKPIEALSSSPLLLSRTLYQLVEQQVGSSSKGLRPGLNGKEWYLLQQKCTFNPMITPTPLLRDDTEEGSSLRFILHCPMHTGYCCHIFDASEANSVVLMTKHPLLPYQLVPSNLPKPFNPAAGHYQEDEIPFISTISEEVMKRPETPLVTPNFFDTLLKNNCLPSDVKCSTCLRDKFGANCKKCKSVCGCYCKSLCHVTVDEKFVSKKLIVSPPLYARDPSRIIPRIIHQTWFEEVTPEKYPNMSRLIQSFQQSGWEYKFYTDDVAAVFLSTHFPPEVRQAYDALRPGAFKADLFRYCVLLIHGGVYADMDVMLESNLDAAVSPDVGFMVPRDEPGKNTGHRMCLWNGMIAAAPGHPYLARTIENVVNHVRNRFTSVDVDAEFCPSPELSVLHAFDTLFTAGPCALGASLNQVLGRNGQTSFESGDIEPWSKKHRSDTEKGTSFVLGADENIDLRLPGRTIILHQDKWDMGAHRFTRLDQNMVVAATDMPDYDDRKQIDDGGEHYSKTHAKIGIYGLDKLYVDNKKANEDIRIYVQAKNNRHKTAVA